MRLESLVAARAAKALVLDTPDATVDELARTIEEAIDAHRNDPDYGPEAESIGSIMRRCIPTTEANP